MQDKNLETLQEIRQIMSRSSRFISLSGLSGISAGICALIGAFFAQQAIINYYPNYSVRTHHPKELRNQLLIIAALVFTSALALSFIFTYKKTRQDGIPIWGEISKRLMWNTMIPVVVGGIFILFMMQENLYKLIAPACLIFYGLGLLNGSKYTLNEIKYLGYAQILIGIANLFFPGYGLYFWALGFGILHIIYGFIMWNKYERLQKTDQ